MDNRDLYRCPMVEQVEADGPLGLMAAVFTGEFIEPAGEAAVEAEVIPIEGKHLASDSCVV